MLRKKGDRRSKGNNGTCLVPLRKKKEPFHEWKRRKESCTGERSGKKEKKTIRRPCMGDASPDCGNTKSGGQSLERTVYHQQSPPSRRNQRLAGENERKKITRKTGKKRTSRT